MKLIAFVGYPLSGKSTAAKIAEEMGIPVVIMGDIIRKEVMERGLELNDENAGKVAKELREKEGMDAVAKKCLPEIKRKASNTGVVIVDGIRGIAEIERFRKEFGDDFILIGIESSTEKRFERALKRRREDDIDSIDKLRERDRREESWGMSEAFEKANIIVENNSDIDSFREKIREILRNFFRAIEVEIETPLHPTEDAEKVIKAIKNLFPEAKIEVDDVVRGKSEVVDHFRELLRRQRILDTARTEMIRNTSGNEITLLLNKQTATVSKINFVEEDAVLSPLRVTFRVYGVKIEKFIDYMAPETREGKPVREIEWSEVFE